MSGTPILDSKAFLEQDFEAVKLPGPWMVADCRETIHPDPAVRAFRTAVPICFGDFDLRVFFLKRAEAKGVSFERFIASHLRRVFAGMGDTVPEGASQRFNFRGKYSARELARMPKAEQASTYPNRSPVEVLWDAVDFGRLRWDLQDKRLEKLAPNACGPMPLPARREIFGKKAAIARAAAGSERRDVPAPLRSCMKRRRFLHVHQNGLPLPPWTPQRSSGKRLPL